MKETMDQIMATMKLLEAQTKSGKGNNENKNPNTGGNNNKKKPSATLGGKPAHLKEEKSKCPHCNRWCLHLDKDCLELEANAANQSASWKTNKKTTNMTK